MYYEFDKVIVIIIFYGFNKLIVII